MKVSTRPVQPCQPVQTESRRIGLSLLFYGKLFSELLGIVKPLLRQGAIRSSSSTPKTQHNTISMLTINPDRRLPGFLKGIT